MFTWLEYKLCLLFAVGMVSEAKISSSAFVLVSLVLGFS